MTSGGYQARPLEEAAAILGDPVRRDGRVVLTAALQSPQVPGERRLDAGESTTSYLTITY